MVFGFKRGPSAKALTNLEPVTAITPEIVERVRAPLSGNASLMRPPRYLDDPMWDNRARAFDDYGESQPGHTLREQGVLMWEDPKNGQAVMAADHMGAKQRRSISVHGRQLSAELSGLQVFATCGAYHPLAFQEGRALAMPSYTSKPDAPSDTTTFSWFQDQIRKAGGNPDKFGMYISSPEGLFGYDQTNLPNRAVGPREGSNPQDWYDPPMNLRRPK